MNFFHVLLIGLTVAANANGETPLHVKLELADGREMEARCLTPTFRLETDYGILELNLNKMRDIGFQASGDRMRIADYHRVASRNALKIE